jgi:hypothetical protein
MDDQKVILTASYLSNALDAVARSVNGHHETTALFTEEPGEYRWCFKRISNDKLSVEILWFDETFGNRPDSEGKVILATECRLRTFAGAILSASQRVLAMHGLEGYRELWVHHEFPTILQANLKAALEGVSR